MSELTRAEKLAAARQKLINFQNKSNGTSKTSKQMTTDPLTQKQEYKIQEKPTDMEVNQVDDIFNINPPITQTSQANEIRTFNASQFFDNIPNNNSTEFLNIDSDSLSSSYVDTNVQEMITENSSPDLNYEHQKQIQASSEVTPDPASGYDESGRSSSASLRQLSLKINGLIGSLAAEDENNHKMEIASNPPHIDQSSVTDRFVQLEQRNRELENEIRQQSERYEKRLQNLEALEEQLKLHAQTVGILVAEKTELEAALNKSQDLAKIKSSECEEQQSNLRIYQHKIDDLSNQLIALNSTNISMEEKYHQLEQQSNQSQKIIEETKQQLLETVQLREETSARLTEVLTKCSHLEQQLADKTNDLNLTQIRLQQLGLEYESASGETKAVDGRQLETALEQAEASLNETKKSHEQQTRQYQAYMKQLNTQLQQASEQNISLKNERDILAFREQERVEHVSQLERRLQELQGKLNQAQQQLQQFEQQQHTNNSETDKHEALEKENQSLNDQISHLEEALSNRELKLKELEEQMTLLLQEQEETDTGNTTQAEQAQLLAAIESDKVAAARAISQNQMLKSQLDVMTECFNNINESKLELMDTLHRERREARRLRETVEDYEKELNRLRDRLLDSETKLAEASGIPLDQWRDRWRRHSQDHHHDHDHDHDHHHHHHDHDHDHDHDHHHHHHYEESPRENHKTDDITESIHGNNIIEENNEDEESSNQEEEEGEEVAEKTTQTTQESLISSPQAPSSEPNSSNLRQAMEQLQRQFTRKMSQIAELNDEKQRLEHIVMQLQSETETIGEYVALYQTQRCALRERAREKDEAMRKLARDKEEMRCKLTRLESLVGRLVVHNHEQPQHQETPNDSSNVLPTETSTTNEVFDQPKDISTAGQILALLKEIGSSNLVEGQQTSCMEPFHPCPLCSGRLLTV